jgi:hypothetical protein
MTQEECGKNGENIFNSRKTNEMLTDEEIVEITPSSANRYYGAQAGDTFEGPILENSYTVPIR